MRHDRECVICGRHYDYCPNCAQYDEKPRWMFMFDNENCKKIYDVVNDYKIGKIDAQAARSRFNNLDMSQRGQFVKGFKRVVDEIYAKTSQQAQHFNKKDNKK